MRYINVIRGMGDVQNCVQAIQVELVQRGIGFTRADVTGSWNDRTSAMLDFLYNGDRSSWRNLGSDCDVLDDLKNPNGGSVRTIIQFAPQEVPLPRTGGAVTNASGPGTSSQPSNFPGAPAVPNSTPGAPAAVPGTILGIPIEYVGYGAVALILYSVLGNRHA